MTKTARELRQEVLNRFEYISYFLTPGVLEEDTTFQFHITDTRLRGERVSLYLQTTGDRCEIFEGVAQQRGVEITVDFRYWLELQAKRLGPLSVAADLLIGKQIRVKGRLMLFLRFGQIFGGSLDNSHLCPESTEQGRELLDVQGQTSRPRRVVILSGSGRQKDRATSYHFARFFATGLDSASSELSVEIIHLRDYNLRPCKGCFSCWKTGGRCAIRDDYAKIVGPKVNTCDLLVLAFPLYFYDFPPEIRKVLTRFFCRDHPLFRWCEELEDVQHYDREPYPFSIFLLGVGGAFDMTQFEIPARQIELLSKRHNIPIAGSLFRNTSNSFLVPAARTPLLEEVESAVARAGRELGLTGQVSLATKRAVEQPVVTPPQLRAAAYAHFKEMNGSFKFPSQSRTAPASPFDISTRARDEAA